MRLWIKNFRAIREQELDIAPITVLYGMNGTGKSSVLYAMLTLKNIVLNPISLWMPFSVTGFWA